MFQTIKNSKHIYDKRSTSYLIYVNLPCLALAGVPGELDRVRLDVGDGEVAHAYGRAEHGALEGTTTRHRLVLVESRGARFTEDVLNYLLDGGHTARAAGQLHRVDVVEFELCKWMMIAIIVRWELLEKSEN